MRIEKIELEGFRSYEKSGADFVPGVNVISGDNAQGKTNLLEAIYLVCTGRSFRTRSDKDMIGFDRELSFISARGEYDDREKKTELTLRRTGRRVMTVNGVKIRTSAQLSEGYSCVLFCPEDLGLIREGGAVRRRMMDMCISQLRPRYADAIAEYGRAYEQKTRILKDGEDKPSLYSLLPEYNARMVRFGAEIIHYRAHFINKLTPYAAKIHSEFSGGEELGLEYRTVKTVTDPLGPVSEIVNQLSEHMEKHAAAERASGMCLSGAHKDDIYVTVNGAEARSFASQGQARTAALSIKLAEREIHYSQRGEYPILLLDDVLSELDPGRQSFILNRIGGGQVFITCCEDEAIIADRTGGRVMRVTAGRITV